MDSTRSALIVATDRYTDPGLRRLRAPGSDARALAAVLRDPRIGDFEVRTLLNKPAHVVNLVVEEFFADRRPGDLLLVHFTGHGVKDEEGELYFAAVNTMLGRLGATAVAAEFVSRRMTRSRSRRVVLLLDCCYAGAFDRGLLARAGVDVGIEQQFGGRGRAVITASTAMGYAFESGQLADTREVPPSVFTSALVQGLETGEADRDQDGLIGLDELYDYVYDKVREATPNQTPGKWVFGVEGELYIARRSRPVATPAPAETATADASPSASPSPSRSRPSRVGVWLLAAAALVAASVTAIAISLSGGGGGLPTGPGSLAATLKNPKYTPYALAFAPGAGTLAVGSGNDNLTAGATYVWDTATKSITATLTDPGSKGVSSVAFGPGGTTLATGDDNGSTYLWDTATKSITATLTDPGSIGVDSVAFGPGGTTLAVGDNNGSTYLWDTATKSITATLTDPQNDAGVNSVAFGPGGTTLATGDGDGGSTVLWDTATKRITATLTDPQDQGVNSVAFGPGGTTLAVADDNGSTYLWDIATKRITATLTDPYSGGVSSVAFGPGGTTLAATDEYDSNLYLWDIATKSITATLTDPENESLGSVAFGPGGTTLAAIGGSIYLWEIASHTS